MGLDYSYKFVSSQPTKEIFEKIRSQVAGETVEAGFKLSIPGLHVAVHELEAFMTEAAIDAYGVAATRSVTFRLTDFSVPNLEQGIVKIVNFLLNSESGDAVLPSLGGGPAMLRRIKGKTVVYDSPDSGGDFLDDPAMRALLIVPYTVEKRSR